MSQLALLLAAAAAIVLAPSDAWAWGPVTHLVHGAMLLERLPMLPPDVASLLARFPYEYLYGCIGADIVQAKKFTKSLYTHCHHWRTGWEVLDGATTESEQAFARGYLSHLASDTFSHNYYLPVRLISSFRSTSMQHVYWEARFDANQAEERWPLLTLVASNLYPHCDELVERIVERTLFSFRTNKRIFDSLLALQRLEYWQTVMQRATDSQRHPLPREDIERFNGLCANAIVDLMQNGRGAACQADDPTGQENLDRAKRIRNRLRGLARRGVLDEEREREILASAIPPLEASLGSPS
ncbi:MAG: zinc dependent phospholipase C family protein [Candidatus Binatia bacterium]|nr:zinc dependent phospholipase C family protein [Candidatus Binatia bacterium]